MGNKVKENMVTPAGTLRWTWLDKPDSSPKGKNKFKTAIVLDKDNGGKNDALAKKLLDLHKSVKGKRDKAPVKDGDAMAEDDQKNEWARGKWVMTAKSKDRPQCVAANRTPLAKVPNTGDLAKLVIYVTDYDVDGSTGVAALLNGVQLLERRNKGRDVSSMFEDESDEYGTDTAEADTTERDGEGEGEGGDSGGSDGDY